MRKDIVLFDLGINANGDENGLYHIKVNGKILKSGTYNACDKFSDRLIEKMQIDKSEIKQLKLF